MDDFEENQSLLRLADKSAVTVQVHGMKCQSCVRKIEENIKNKLGIVDIKVNLEDKEAHVEYDPNLINAIVSWFVTECCDSLLNYYFKGNCKSDQISRL